jgi:eukaryotic-like serine/threonine-protein kinase
MIGRLFMGRYEAKRLLGEGGTGRVYLARQYQPDRYVVVKVMHEHLAQDSKFKDRFERETQTMAKLQHPHAVQLLDAALDDPGGPCIVMEYIHGVGLDVHLKKNKRFTPARVGRLLVQLCDVLQAAHDMQIIHRDLKPSNLMIVNADTPDEQVKVMDFGLAKILNPLENTKKITDANMEFAIGTPSYISPEQIRGEAMDHRGDLYSAGVIAYELLSGQLPFHRESHMDVILAHATEIPPTFAEMGLENWVPAAVERVVMDCLEKEPGQRPQTARELAERFEAALGAKEEAPKREPKPKADAAPQAVVDPNALVFQIDAWMPQKIALVKLRGFVHDALGEVIESDKGVIRVHLGVRPSQKPGEEPTFFGRRGGNPLYRTPLDVELRLQHVDAKQENHLLVTVLFHPPDRYTLDNAGWRRRCEKVFCDVRAYLMGRTQS